MAILWAQPALFGWKVVRCAFDNSPCIHNFNRVTQSHYENNSYGGQPRGSFMFSAIAFGTICGRFGWYIGSNTASQPTLLDKTLAKPMRDTSSTTPISRSIKPDHDISIANLTAIRKEIASVIEEANLINSLGGIERHVGTE